MEIDEYLKRIQIVLVETQDGANIGSVCRAMKTMGIEDLGITGDGVYSEDRVKTLALHAGDVYDHAKRYKDLDEALAGSVFTVGATRRRGKFRKMSAYSPEQLAEKISTMPEGRISIVFGREADGLRDDEVAKCSAIVTIPTSDRFPSLNLSQAVQIICYALFTKALPYKPGMVAVTRERAEKGVASISENLSAIGYYKWDEEKKWTEQFLTDVIERAGLSEGEMQKFEKLFQKAQAIARFKKE